jgi:hypothetical protein
MNSTKFIIGTIVGGIVSFVLGFLIYAILLADFFSAHSGTAVNAMKTEMEFWPILLGSFGHGALLSYIFLQWAKINTFSGGLKGGTVIGFLVAFSYDMISYDTTNLMDLTGAIADVVVATLMFAIIGGIVGWVVGLGKK